jgi:hypothetical protein
MVHPKARELSFDEYIERYYRSIGRDAERDPEIQELLKADDRYDYGSTDYNNPVYSLDIALEALTRSTVLYRVLPKTTYLDKGDSLHNITSDATYMRSFLGEEGQMFVSDTVIPTISDLDRLWPAVFHIGWEDTRVGREMEKFQARPRTDIEYLRTFFNDVYANGIDQQLAGVYLSATVHGVDTPATQYSKAQVETIDRMISDATESGAANHVSVDTDGDIYWNETNTGSAKIDRSAVSWADSQIKLPSSAGTEDAYNILDELDDLMAVAKHYAPTAQRNYIGLCSDKALNKIQDELDPKVRYLEQSMDVYQTLNGVSTRPGKAVGKLSVPALGITGVLVPFFTSPYLSGQASPWVWENSKYTTGGVGNIYLINMDNIEIRHLIPITYSETPNYGDWILGNRHSIYSAMQLLCKRFASHAALKYIKA